MAPVASHWTSSSTTDVTMGIGQKVGSTKTYNHNGLKSVEAQSQSATSLSSTRVYDAWGAVVSSTGTHAGRFGHGGAYGYQSDSNDLQLLGHRFYDPNAGRFLTRDRIKDGRNWYAYCENNPSTSIDSNGLRSFSLGGGGQMIGGLFSISVTITLVVDLDNGQFGFGITGGFGPALGLSAGVEAVVAYDETLQVGNPGQTDQQGYASGIASPVGSIELYDTDGNVFGGGDLTGGGIGYGPGLGGGIFREKRYTGILPMGRWWD